jgi:hypothetical protein
MTDEEIKHEIRHKLSVRQPVAFRALRLGRRAGKAAIKAGNIPVTTAGTVPTLLDGNGTEATVQAAEVGGAA